MKSSASSQLLRPPCALTHLLLWLLLLLWRSEGWPWARLVKGWQRLCTERDFSRLPFQSEGVPSGLEERGSRGLTSRLICLLQTPSDFKPGFSRSCTSSWAEPGSLSPSTCDLTTTEGPTVPWLFKVASTGHWGWEGGKMGGSWRVKPPPEEGGGGRSGKCALLVILGVAKFG